MPSTLSPPGATRPGDELFESAVRPHLRALLSFARSLLGSDDLAHDVVQEALIALWHERPPPERRRAWLQRTVLHRSLHARRSASRRLRHETGCGRPDCEVCEHSDPARAAELAELRRALQQAVEGLPGPFRDVFVLREVEGLDYDAIARRLAIPAGTVRSRLSRARSELRSRLGDGNPEASAGT
ncbi:MAG: sigma-70 family RNA polymerase sigma factor [Planctomycetes bacterium]|nr:sigma-70 family RNA polymerase sigma factor [Planctomycetota bacterium]